MIFSTANVGSKSLALLLAVAAHSIISAFAAKLHFKSKNLKNPSDMKAYKKRKLDAEGGGALEDSSRRLADGICVDNPVGWFDIEGDGCDWYAATEWRCRIYGNEYKNKNTTANQACCACGGGILSKNLTWFGFNGCSSSSPCGLCEGDCDNDSDCAGDLKCFLRDHLTPIPGCTGSGETGGDYCYNSSFVPTPDPTPNKGICIDNPVGWVDSEGDGCDWYAIENRCDLYGDEYENQDTTANQACCTCGGGILSKNLTWLGWEGCSSSSPCGLCEGDCDYDSDCAGDLKCFQRDDLTPIPGCVGSGESGGDYCYNASCIPTQLPAPTYSPSSSPTPAPTPAPTTNKGICIDNPVGWVDSGGDGCDWYAIGNHCDLYGETFPNQYIVAKTACCVCGGGILSKNLTWFDWDGCLSTSPCGLCEGHCIFNFQCAGDLKCFQSNGLTIPGCVGSGASGGNYCYNSSYIAAFP